MEIRWAAIVRALLVSYGFPPVGGAGVQRMVKLVKYLPAHGVTPTVLTVANPSVPVVDHSLDADLPSDLRVLRARTFEPGYAVKQAAWTATAQKGTSIAATLKRRLTGVARQLLVPDPQSLCGSRPRQARAPARAGFRRHRRGFDQRATVLPAVLAGAAGARARPKNAAGARLPRRVVDLSHDLRNDGRPGAGRSAGRSKPGSYARRTR